MSNDGKALSSRVRTALSSAAALAFLSFGVATGAHAVEEQQQLKLTDKVVLENDAFYEKIVVALGANIVTTMAQSNECIVIELLNGFKAAQLGSKLGDVNKELHDMFAHLFAARANALYAKGETVPPEFEWVQKLYDDGPQGQVTAEDAEKFASRYASDRRLYEEAVDMCADKLARSLSKEHVDYFKMRAVVLAGKK